MLPLIQGEFRAVADAELRFTPSGMAMGNVRGVANSRKQIDGEWKDDKVCWVKIVAFKRVAENMAESITKGTLFTVTGRMQTEEWEDREGNKRMTVEIVADTIGLSLAFAPAKLMSTEGGGGQASRSSAPEGSDPWMSPPQGQTDEPPF